MWCGWLLKYIINLFDLASLAIFVHEGPFSLAEGLQTKLPGGLNFVAT